jgi:pimeloyl-ACP methyl ester carboxylesterase
MTTYVLVPGFWMGSWAWDGVAARLRAEGHEVVALTPRGVAERAAETDATIETRIADLLDTLREHRDVVLVGHSGGGLVVVPAAERARERVSRLVLVDTGPLPEGMAQIDFGPPEVRAWVEKQLVENDGWYPMPTSRQLAEIGSSTEGIDATAFELIHARTTPEPGGTVTGTARRGSPDRTLPKPVRRSTPECPPSSRWAARSGRSSSCRPGTGRCSPSRTHWSSCCWPRTRPSPVEVSDTR